MIPSRPHPDRPNARKAAASRGPLGRGVALAAWLTATGLGGVAASANDAPRTPLVAPRPAVRVTISSPTADPQVVRQRLEGFFTPPRDPFAKPGVENGAAYLRSPAGRTGPALNQPAVTAPSFDTTSSPVAQSSPVAEPARLADSEGMPVRRIEPVPATIRIGIPLDTRDVEGRVMVVAEPSGPVARVRGVEGEARATDDGFDGTTVTVVDALDGPAVPADPQALDLPQELPTAKPLDSLAVACDQAIEITSARLLTGESRTTASNSPWQIGHGLMALREDYTLIVDGRRVSALDWIASGPSFKGEPWFVRGQYGPKAHEYSGVMYDFEGHPNQILAFLAMSDLPKTFVLKDGAGRPFTIADWIETAKREVRLNRTEEITWTLWAFSVYLDSESQWVNARREPWSMERLVQEEIKSDPTKHACGGTHGLYALASARNARLQEGKPLRGHWLLAHEKVGRYTNLARSLQNPDGSFSDKYFMGRSHQRDLVTRIGSSGHTLEFLMMALPQSELDSPWVRAGVGRVAADLLAGRHAEVGGKAVGGMYHAVHALKLYRERTAEDFTPVRLQTAEGGRHRVIR
ncbi:hypothetical protein [Alienimonas californiensis]|uniref:hypothetical protein n=1 Tax=Alienimonas californiensis TaxID=2527989 RepID=UPI0011AB14F8|nr:hypothetical protein [Alienimonas californiensis]